MKLVIAIVSSDDAKKVSKELVAHGHRVTKLASTGGFLLAGNTTFLVGCEEHKLFAVLQIIKQNCERRKEYTAPLFNSQYGVPEAVEVEVGGAVCFVVDVEEWHKF